MIEFLGIFPQKKEEKPKKKHNHTIMEQKWTRASLEQLKLEIIKTNNEMDIYIS